MPNPNQPDQDDAVEYVLDEKTGAYVPAEENVGQAQGAAQVNTGQQTTRRGLFRALGDLILGKPASRRGRIGHPEGGARVMTRRGMLGTTAAGVVTVATGLGANEARKMVFDDVPPYQEPENASKEEIMKERPSYLTDKEWTDMNSNQRGVNRVDEDRIEEEGESPTSEELGEGATSGGSGKFIGWLKRLLGTGAWEAVKPLAVPVAGSIAKWIILKAEEEILRARFGVGGEAMTTARRDALKTVKSRIKTTQKCTAHALEAGITAAQFVVLMADLEDIFNLLSPHKAVGSLAGEAASVAIAIAKIKNAIKTSGKSWADDSDIVKGAQERIDGEIAEIEKGLGGQDEERKRRQQRQEQIEDRVEDRREKERDRQEQAIEKERDRQEQAIEKERERQHQIDLERKKREGFYDAGEF